MYVWTRTTKDISLSGSTSPSGHLLHKMSVWHTGINFNIFVLNV